MRLFRFFIGFIMLSLLLVGEAMATDAAAIMQTVFDARRVDDQIATLTFHFIHPDEPERQAIYTMVWKDMRGKDGYDNKAIFFTESPLMRKGVAYLGWLRTAGSDKPDDEWIYLPELGMTRRIVPHDNDHAHSEDEYGRSLLDRSHLEPARPDLYQHTLMAERPLHGRPHYLIKSIPKQADNDGLATRVSWVDMDTLRPDLIQFFDSHDQAQLDMTIQWLELQGYWIWQRVDAVKSGGGEQTVLEFSDIRINTGLKERVFSNRSLEGSANRFK